MKTISLTAKCVDLCSLVLNDDKAGRVGEHHGNVPDWLPNPNIHHYGDYVELRIDVDTGRILNWKKPSASNLKTTFGIELDTVSPA